MKQGWEIKKLGEIGKPSMCKRILKNQTSSTGEIPFYKISTFGKIPDAFISKEIYDEFRIKYSFPKKGDILISASGTIGRRVRYDGEPAFFQDSNIVWIDNDEKQVLNDYLYFFYEFCDWQPSKGATIARLYNSNLTSIKIAFPKSLPEQKRIVAILDEAFEAIEKAKANAEQNLKNAKELFESYLQGVFENKGKDWEEKSLSEVCFKITDGSHNPPKGIDFSEYLMISSKNINNDFIDLDSPRYLKKEDFISENKRTDVVEGDVLLTIVGTIGRVAVVTNEHKYFTLQRSVAVLKPKKDIISSRFLMFSLRNIFEELNESARGVAQKGLYLNQIRSIEISIPKLKTQQIIVEKIDYLLAETKKIETIYQQKINDLEELKKSILQKAFSGELK